MSYLDHIDKKTTIKKAKKVLDEYKRFRRIINNAYYDIGLQSHVAKSIGNFSSRINSDAKLINKIDKKDRDYESLKSYIDGIEYCISLLDLEKIELLNLRYGDCLTNAEIMARYEKNNRYISERQLNRKMNICYIEFAIAYGIHIEKEQKL